MSDSLKQYPKLPVEDKNPTRNKIMVAALEEFNRLGLTGARVDAIAEKAGVNKAMIYYHFSSKKNLYHEIIKITIGNLVQRVSDDVEKSESLEEALLGIARNYSRLYGSTETLLPLLLRELANPDSDFINQITEMVKAIGLPQKIRDRIEERVKDGEVREIDFAQAMASFVTMNIGYFVLSPIINRVMKITDPDKFVEKRAEAVVDIFLNGIKAK